MTLKDKLYNYFSINPIDDYSENKYKAVRNKFKISSNTASKYWIDYKREVENKGNEVINKNYYNDTLNITATVDYEIKTIEDLMAACDVNPNEYEVTGWEVSKREVKVENEFKPLFSLKARFKPIKIEQNLEVQKQIILKELYAKSPRSFTSDAPKKSHIKTSLLELALFDMHFGKLAHAEETGEEYNMEVATKRWFDAINSLLNRVNLNTVGRILLPIGNDLLNSDNYNGTTTAGTPQDNDGRYHKIVRAVRDILITTINGLSKIAPVDIIIVQSNHDQQTMFLLGDIIEAYYHNNSTIKVLNDPTTRKYYKYGSTSFMYTHGDKERFNDLGMIFAAENPKLWAETKQRYIKIGHFHHNKLQTVMKQDLQGFQIQILPSLSSSDYWHKSKAYIPIKQAKAFLYDKEEGLIGEFTYTV